MQENKLAKEFSIHHNFCRVVRAPLLFPMIWLLSIFCEFLLQQEIPS